MSSAEKVLKEIEGQVDKYPIIIGAERGPILDEVVRKYRPKRVLEIGTLVGYSAIRMGRLLPPGGRITCVEVNGSIASVARGFIKEAELDGVIEVKVGRAQDIIPRLDGPFDMVFLDAEKTEYLEYLRLVEGKLSVGGVVLADNVRSHASELRNYLQYVRKSDRYKSTYVESETDGLELSVKLA